MDNQTAFQSFEMFLSLSITFSLLLLFGFDRYNDWHDFAQILIISSELYKGKSCINNKKIFQPVYLYIDILNNIIDFNIKKIVVDCYKRIIHKYIFVEQYRCLNKKFLKMASKILLLNIP